MHVQNLMLMQNPSVERWKPWRMGAPPKKKKKHKYNPPIVTRHGHHQFRPQNNEVTQGTYLQTETGTKNHHCLPPSEGAPSKENQQ